jgi:hypothetical protein
LSAESTSLSGETDTMALLLFWMSCLTVFGGVQQGTCHAGTAIFFNVLGKEWLKRAQQGLDLSRFGDSKYPPAH